MIDFFKRLLGGSKNGTSDQHENDAEHEVLIAVCALFLEMGRIDDSFSKEEVEAVVGILRKDYGLSAEEADRLISAADAELKDSVDLWQFARLINETYDTEQKIRIIEMLWKIVYVDGKLDAHEDYLMHKLEQLLRLTHTQLIDAKVKVLHSKNVD